MVRSIESMAAQIYKELGEGNTEGLREWAESIIQECADNFECTMEECEEEDNIQTAFDRHGEPVNPVLVRQSILKVKEQIK